MSISRSTPNKVLVWMPLAVTAACTSPLMAVLDAPATGATVWPVRKRERNSQV